MKKTLLLVAILTLVGCSSSVSTDSENGDAKDEPVTVDHSTPEAVLEAVFEAAASEDFSYVANLCDPKKGNDSDTDRICELMEEGHEEDHSEFVTMFKNGEINGETVFKDDKAEIPFLFGPEADQEETMDLIKRGENWYLFQF